MHICTHTHSRAKEYHGLVRTLGLLVCNIYKGTVSVQIFERCKFCG